MFEDDCCCDNLRLRSVLLFCLSACLALTSLASLIVVADSDTESHDRRARLVYAVVAVSVAGSVQVVSAVASAAARGGFTPALLTGLNVVGGVVLGMVLGLAGRALDDGAPVLIAASAVCTVLFLTNLGVGFAATTADSDRLFS